MKPIKKGREREILFKYGMKLFRLVPVPIQFNDNQLGNSRDDEFRQLRDVLLRL